MMEKKVLGISLSIKSGYVDLNLVREKMVLVMNPVIKFILEVFLLFII